MSYKAIKLKNDTFIDSTGIVHNREILSDKLANINVLKQTLVLNSIAVNQSTNETTLGSYTATSAGEYLILGIRSINFYGISGREIVFRVRVNGAEVSAYTNIVSPNAYTNEYDFHAITHLDVGDVVTFTLQSSTANNWAYNASRVYFLKLI